MHRITLELKKKNELVDEKARLLEEQTGKLTDLNNLKNKLFSVISHDLRAPLYALRNLFKSMQQYDLPAEEIKQFVPEVVNDLNYTTALMENLLLWVKSQMQIHALYPEVLDVSVLIKEGTDLLRLQAFSKQILIDSQTDPVYIYADKDMVSLVLRNLLSNAIKFTKQGGNIKIGTIEKTTEVEIYVKDTGMGMEQKVVDQLFKNTFYSTKGTDNETGTGIGLMLCNDFLNKNGGTIQVSSELGKGSTFSISLPRRKTS
jgi:signal transduction histidine kinase